MGPFITQVAVPASQWWVTQQCLRQSRTQMSLCEPAMIEHPACFCPQHETMRWMLLPAQQGQVKAALRVLIHVQGRLSTLPLGLSKSVPSSTHSPWTPFRRLLWRAW